jgi:hypothetical protein
MPWQVGQGSKLKQQAHVPDWILSNEDFSKACLRGLLQTDGSIYTDRTYLMVNFTNLVKPLVDDVYVMISKLGFIPHLYESTQPNGNVKYVVRVSKNVADFISFLQLTKT